MRLITWNVNRRVGRLAAQAAALAGREPDVVALQEVTARTWPLWQAALVTIGLEHALCSLDGADPRREPATRRRTGVVITVISFARDSRARLRPERGTRWDDAELGIVPRLAELGFADAFRAVHGYASREPSWVWSHGGGWRLDHLFAAGVEVLGSRYHHAWRDDGLSDHSALEVDLRTAAG